MLAKWILYTVLCGAIPIFGRLIIFSTANHGELSALNAGDFIAYGLVLHISMLNALESFWVKKSSWATTINGLSIFGIVLYAILFTINTIPNISNDYILNFSIICSLASVTLGVTVQVFLIKGISMQGSIK